MSRPPRSAAVLLPAVLLPAVLLPAVLLPAVLLAAGLVGGCAQKVHVRTEPPGRRVVVEGKDLGAVPRDGVQAEVPPGVGPVRVQIDEGGTLHDAFVPRTGLETWLAATAVAGAVCCVPTLAAAGLCAANPALLAASIGCILTQGNFTLCCTALAQPTWCTLPLGAIGAALGMTPLGLLFLAEKPPEQIVVKAPARGGAGDVDEPPSTGEMPW